MGPDTPSPERIRGFMTRQQLWFRSTPRTPDNKHPSPNAGVLSGFCRGELWAARTSSVSRASPSLPRCENSRLRRSPSPPAKVHTPFLLKYRFTREHPKSRSTRLGEKETGVHRQETCCHRDIPPNAGTHCPRTERRTQDTGGEVWSTNHRCLTWVLTDLPNSRSGR